MNQQQTPYHTPILLIAFNRYDTTIQVFENIRKLKPKYLFIAVDGPRKDKPGEKEKVDQVKSIFNNIDWDCEVKTRFQESNLGCKMGVSSAISWFFEFVEMGIIIEDDIILDPSFFPFAEDLLEYYKDDEKVMNINACNFQPIRRSLNSYYFSSYSLVWGWATWKRAWVKYTVSMEGFNQFQKKNELSEFIKNKQVVKRFYQKMYSIISGELDTWDYQWNYTIWKNKGLSITPEINLVINIGFGENATHTYNEDFFASQMKLNKMNFPIIHPLEKSINKKADSFYENFVIEPSFIKRFVSSRFTFFYKKIIKHY